MDRQDRLAFQRWLNTASDSELISKAIVIQESYEKVKHNYYAYLDYRYYLDRINKELSARWEASR